MTNETSPIQVVLADDHAVVRQGIKDFLEEQGDIKVVAEASNGKQALDLISEHKPHVAVLDIQMPEMTGIEVTRAVRAEKLPVGILILSAYDDDPYVLAVLQAGANGYVLKNAGADDIVRAVHAVYKGQSALDPIIARKMIAHVTGAAELHTPTPPETLTSRELEVLQMAARGYTNKAIAVQLKISDRTVQGHLANIYAKLGVSTRTEAVMIGVRNSWVTTD